MAEWTMCPATECPVRVMCVRNEASGTKPSETQMWFREPPIFDGFCDQWLMREDVDPIDEDDDDVDL